MILDVLIMYVGRPFCDTKKCVDELLRRRISAIRKNAGRRTARRRFADEELRYEEMRDTLPPTASDCADCIVAPPTPSARRKSAIKRISQRAIGAVRYLFDSAPAPRLPPPASRSRHRSPVNAAGPADICTGGPPILCMIPHRSCCAIPHCSQIKCCKSIK